MRKIFTTLFVMLTFFVGMAQPIYKASNYANMGDTAYLTSVQLDTAFNFLKSGANYTWNFATINGVSQEALAFRNPTKVGFSAVQWPYIYNTNNVNVSTATGQDYALGQITVSNRNDFYLKNTDALLQKASSYTLSASGTSLDLKNTFTTVDSIYKFPLKYLDTFSSTAGFTTIVPFIFYSQEILKRTNKVDGWGKLITPYGTFNNCLRVVSEVMQQDTFGVTGFNIPRVYTRYRELKWLDTTKGYPVLYVTQTYNGFSYVTQSVKYLDIKKTFPPNAVFYYTPFQPNPGDTVTFYNFSTASTSYLWNFGDGTGTTTEINPIHIFYNPGVYTVSLIAYNGTVSDTQKVVITVSGKPLSFFAYSPIAPKIGDTVKFNNQSTKGVTYLWDFGDSTTTSSLKSPNHVYKKAGTFKVKLISYNTFGSDTIVIQIKIANPLAVDFISFNAKRTNGLALLQWSTSLNATANNFSIERSTDGVHFSSIGSLPANRTAKYQFTDADRLTSGKVFYRIKAIEADGKISYSPVVQINSLAIDKNSILVYPNPVVGRGVVKVLVQSLENQSITLEVLNINGQVVGRYSHTVIAGSNALSLPSNALKSGAYFIKCLANNSNELLASTNFVVTE